MSEEKQSTDEELIRVFSAASVAQQEIAANQKAHAAQTAISGEYSKRRDALSFAVSWGSYHRTLEIDEVLAVAEEFESWLKRGTSTH